MFHRAWRVKNRPVMLLRLSHAPIHSIPFSVWDQSYGFPKLQIVAVPVEICHNFRGGRGVIELFWLWLHASPVGKVWPTQTMKIDSTANWIALKNITCG